jgi:hypothetical protein
VSGFDNLVAVLYARLAKERQREAGGSAQKKRFLPNLVKANGTPMRRREVPCGREVFTLLTLSFLGRCERLLPILVDGSREATP